MLIRLLNVIQGLFEK